MIERDLIPHDSVRRQMLSSYRISDVDTVFYGHVNICEMI